jgi:hypothetical protein
MLVDAAPRILDDALLGRIDLTALEAKLNESNANITMVKGADTVALRIAHFENNGRQLYNSVQNVFGRLPMDERLAALARVTTGQGVILPPGVGIVACGARLCLEVR